MNIWRHTPGRNRLYRPSVTSVHQMPECARCPVRDHSLCVGLQPFELPRISELTTVCEAEPGETIFYEGDGSDYFYTLRRGVVRLVRAFPDGRRSIVGFLHDGDFLGGRFGERVHHSTAEAVTKLEYCRIAVDDLQSLAEEFPGLERQLLSMSGDRMDAAEDHIVLLSRKTAAEKVAAFLLAAQEWEHAEGDEFDLPMSRSDIADYLGLTIETVSRVLTKLSGMKLIAIRDARHIIINDEDELKLLARPESDGLDDF